MIQGQKYRSDIDGLRALAVLPVVLYHAGTPAVSGGYVGVDIFFVISGYLITGIINREINEKKFSLVAFYERRARRILPALFAMTIVCFIAAWFVGMPIAFKQFADSVLATILFSSNIYFWKSTDYFSTSAEFRFLLHTWSLAVEEQFYLFWPICLIVASRFSKRLLINFVVATIFFSFVASVVGAKLYEVANFYLIPTRVWELMCGAVLALGMVPPCNNARAKETLAWIGLILILFSIFAYDAYTPFPGLTALVPCLGAAILIYSGETTRVGYLLSNRPVVFVGLISYSLYLWHWPIFVFLRIVYGTAELPPDIAAAAVIGSVIIAILSWRFVERPFRRRGLFARRHVFFASGAGMTAFLLLSIGIIGTDGVPNRFSESVLSISAGEKDAGSNRISCSGKLPKDGLCRVGDLGTTTSVLFWGDSHAGALMPALDVASLAAGKSAIIASHTACAPLIGVRRIGYNWKKCDQFNRTILNMVEDKNAKIDTVVLAARWALNATGKRAPGEPGRGVRLVRIGEDNDEGDSEILFQEGLEALIGRLHAKGIRVVILGGVPEIGWNVPSTMALRLKLGLPPPYVPTLSDVQARNAEADKTIKYLAEKFGAEFVPIAPLLCRPACQLLDGNSALYIDDDHLSAHGARHVLGARLVGKIW